MARTYLEKVVQKSRNSKFWAKENKLLICPIPGCNHKANILTKVHFRNVHGIERDEVLEKYGVPKETENRRLSKAEKNEIYEHSIH